MIHVPKSRKQCVTVLRVYKINNGNVYTVVNTKCRIGDIKHMNSAC